jgi:hypothetical protein
MCLAVSVRNPFTGGGCSRFSHSGAASKPASTQRCPMPKTVRALQSKASAACASLQPGPLRIEFEQQVRMFDLPGRRLVFADHLRQRRPFLFGEPHDRLDHREPLLITHLKKYSSIELIQD